MSLFVLMICSNIHDNRTQNNQEVLEMLLTPGSPYSENTKIAAWHMQNHVLCFRTMQKQKIRGNKKNEKMVETYKFGLSVKQKGS